MPNYDFALGISCDFFLSCREFLFKEENGILSRGGVQSDQIGEAGANYLYIYIIVIIISISINLPTRSNL